MFYSPLRYPGGKNKLAPFVAKLCVENGISKHYIEPYSGGASVALFLIINNYVERITINDKDRSLYAFWYCVLNHTDELCEMIEHVTMTVKEWRKQKEVQQYKEKIDLISLGFSTFYLNRTNHSGIITGGLMGGVKQTGKYLMDCRFNKENLIERIRLIASFKDRISLYNLDALSLIKHVENQKNRNSIFYFDPPYYNKASTLYLNHYKEEDHKNVRNEVKSIKNSSWIISYDNVPEIKELYSEFRKNEFSFKHTAYKTRIGKEIMFFSDDLTLPHRNDWDPIKFKLDRRKKQLIYRG